MNKELLEPADMRVNLNALSEKLQTLSAEQISEVEDFVEFLRVRIQEWELTGPAAAASAPAFTAFWNNSETTLYESAVSGHRKARRLAQRVNFISGSSCKSRIIFCCAFAMSSMCYGYLEAARPMAR